MRIDCNILNKIKKKISTCYWAQIWSRVNLKNSWNAVFSVCSIPFLQPRILKTSYPVRGEKCIFATNFASSMYKFIVKNLKNTLLTNGFNFLIFLLWIFLARFSFLTKHVDLWIFLKCRFLIKILRKLDLFSN